MATISGTFYKVWRFYYDGFKQMTIGKSLWALILVKLFLFFVVMKLLFFPNILKRDYSNDKERAEAVREHLSRPGNNTNLYNLL
ncbi:MAG: DUF4492 domain-containing protein [Muribaculaceae bacterium]|nr:DUF4492 domain-containing protein [Muribaculaceae bacterium]